MEELDNALPSANRLPTAGSLATTDRGTSRDAIRSELITAVQFAQLLSVSERTLYRLKSTGKLPDPIVLGGLVRWRLTEVHRWIDQGCPQPRSTP